MKNQKKIGLALSGGGYRAAAYHIGTLRKLREMNLLNKVDVISSNSGGSITAATYCLNAKDFDRFERIMAEGLKQDLIFRLLFSWRFTPVLLLLLCFPVLVWFFANGSWAILSLSFTLVLLGFFQYQLLPFSKGNEASYRDLFHGKATLGDLPKAPLLVINSTNLDTGRPFTFATDEMTDSLYAFPENGRKGTTFRHHFFPIARAVAASSCVPFAFSPVMIGKEFYTDQRDYEAIKPRLVDGGVYDNQGIHKIAFRGSSYACDTIIVCDAGNSMPFRNTYRNMLALLIRVSDVFMNRIKNVQMIDLLFDSVKAKNREVAYHSLGWDHDKSIDEFIRALRNDQILDHVWKAHGISSEELEKGDWDNVRKKLLDSVKYERVVANANTPAEAKLARSIGTNLTPLSDRKVKVLINHAFVMTELQIRLYCPSLVQ